METPTTPTGVLRTELVLNGLWRETRITVDFRGRPAMGRVFADFWNSQHEDAARSLQVDEEGIVSLKSHPDRSTGVKIANEMQEALEDFFENPVYEVLTKTVEIIGARLERLERLTQHLEA